MKIIFALLFMLSFVPPVLIGQKMGTESEFIMMFIWIVEMLILLCIGKVVLLPKQMKDKVKEKQHQKIEFYRKCVEQGILNLNTPTKRQKAELIAASIGFQNVKNLDTLFSEGQELCKTEDFVAHEEELRKMRMEEAEQQKSLDRYADYQGREKRIAMLTDLRNEMLQAAEQYKRGSGTLATMGLQKEKSWALRGGIASGLAGGAAGLAVAADTQIKNAQIRAQNAAYMQRMGPATMNMMQASRKAANDAEHYAQQIVEAKTKLVADINESDVMEYITIWTEKVYISKTGAFTVSAKAAAKDLPDMFEGRQVVLDGTISADLYQNNIKVGSALLVLPWKGLRRLNSGDRTTTTLTGMCCCNADPSKNYEVKFSPYHLWLMEA